MDVKIPTAMRADLEAVATAGLIGKCVHCGLCSATCPTYGLEQDERDSPRGRIYLVKQLLEGTGAASVARKHLDRCLTCRACETACPSGVEYSRIAHYGRAVAERTAPRSRREQLIRSVLHKFVRNRTAGRLGRFFAFMGHPLLPRGLKLSLARPLPRRRLSQAPPHIGRTTLIAGCAQDGFMPETNEALRLLLRQAGFSVQLDTASKCCGALGSHMGQSSVAQRDIQHTLANCDRDLDAGSDAILMAASGCSSFIKEYPHMISLGSKETTAARRVAAAVTDTATFLLANLDRLRGCIAGLGQGCRITVHTPCTQAHGLRSSPNAVAELLDAAGFQALLPTRPPSCCGSAGTYSILQGKIARRLRADMADSLEQPGGEAIVSSNIGCIMHLRRGTNQPVHHWLDLLVSDNSRWPWRRT